ncbi:MAG: hypothetical protein JXB07_10155, partial [Anaerolineae bacterium]|nr:hypothetical protein [Anaerolineae bacterium]
VEVAGSGDTITFGVNGTITLTGGEIGIAKNLSIAGPGAGSLSVSGGGASRVFNISSGAVFISGMTIRDGRATSGGGVDNGGTLRLANVTITANHAVEDNGSGGVGGGIFNSGTLTISNSMISGNTADSYGGGIAGGRTTIVSSTIANNHANGYAGGLANMAGGIMQVSNSTITGNSADSFGGAVFATFTGSIKIVCSRISGNTTSSPDRYDVEVAIPQGVLQVNDNWWGAATGPNTPGADTTNATVSSFLTSPDAACGVAGGPPDDRINWLHGDSYAILYPRVDDKGKPDLHVYCMDAFGNGALELIVTQEMFDESPKRPAKNTEVARTDKCRIPVKVYVLTTGEYQVNIGPDIGGTTQEIVFTGLPPARVYFKHFNLYQLFR